MFCHAIIERKILISRKEDSHHFFFFYILNPFHSMPCWSWKTLCRAGYLFVFSQKWRTTTIQSLLRMLTFEWVCGLLNPRKNSGDDNHWKLHIFCCFVSPISCVCHKFCCSQFFFRQTINACIHATKGIHPGEKKNRV